MKGFNLNIMAAFAILLFFLPITVLLIRKLWSDTFLRIFSIYAVIEGIVNLLDFIPGVSAGFISTLNVIYNMLDFPMMLFLVYQIAAPEKFKTFVKVSMVVYAVFQVYYIMQLGIQYDAIKYPMGLGLLLVIGSALWMLGNYLARPDLSNRQKVYMMVLAAILFDYGTFVVIYIFDYFVPDSSIRDNMLIYYASSIVGIVVAVAGILMVRNKPKVRKPKQGIFYGQKPITEIY